MSTSAKTMHPFAVSVAMHPAAGRPPNILSYPGHRLSFTHYMENVPFFFFTSRLSVIQSDVVKFGHTAVNEGTARW